MECLLLFLMISPISDESVEFRKELLVTDERRINEAPLFAHLFRELLSDNLIPLPLEDHISSELKKHALFSDDILPGGPKRLEALTDRVIQYNILVASKFYTNIRLERLAELINTACEVC